MYSRSYAKEVSLKTKDKQVPAVVAALIFTVAAAGMYFTYQQIKPHLAPIRMDRVQ